MVHCEMGKYLQPDTLTPGIFKYLEIFYKNVDPQEKMVILSFTEFAFHCFTKMNVDRCSSTGEKLPSHLIVPCIRFVYDRTFHILGSLFYYDEYKQRNWEQFSKDISECMKLYILALQNAGFIVVATISPFSNTFSKAIKILTNVPYLREYVGVLSYEVGKREIVHIHDPKYVENDFATSFLENDVQFTHQGKEYVASKLIIEDCLTIYEKPLIRRNLDKEDLEQIDSLAPYYLSKEIIESIETLRRNDVIPEASYGTSLFISLTREIFEHFYSNTSDSKYLILDDNAVKELMNFVASINIFRPDLNSDVKRPEALTENVEDNSESSKQDTNSKEVQSKTSKPVKDLGDIDVFIIEEKSKKTVSNKDTKPKESTGKSSGKSKQNANSKDVPPKPKSVRNLKDIDSYIAKEKADKANTSESTEFKEKAKKLEHDIYSQMCNTPDPLLDNPATVITTASGKTLVADSPAGTKKKRKKNISIPPEVKKELIKARIAAAEASKVPTNIDKNNVTPSKKGNSSTNKNISCSKNKGENEEKSKDEKNKSKNQIQSKNSATQEIEKGKNKELRKDIAELKRNDLDQNLSIQTDDSETSGKSKKKKKKKSNIKCLDTSKASLEDSIVSQNSLHNRTESTIPDDEMEHINESISVKSDSSSKRITQGDSKITDDKKTHSTEDRKKVKETTGGKRSASPEEIEASEALISLSDKKISEASSQIQETIEMTGCTELQVPNLIDYELQIENLNEVKKLADLEVQTMKDIQSLIETVEDSSETRAKIAKLRGDLVENEKSLAVVIEKLRLGTIPIPDCVFDTTEDSTISKTELEEASKTISDKNTVKTDLAPNISVEANKPSETEKAPFDCDQSEKYGTTASGGSLEQPPSQTDSINVINKSFGKDGSEKEGISETVISKLESNDESEGITKNIIDTDNTSCSVVYKEPMDKTKTSIDNNDSNSMEIRQAGTGQDCLKNDETLKDSEPYGIEITDKNVIDLSDGSESVAAKTEYTAEHKVRHDNESDNCKIQELEKVSNSSTPNKNEDILKEIPDSAGDEKTYITEKRTTEISKTFADGEVLDSSKDSESIASINKDTQDILKEIPDSAGDEKTNITEKRTTKMSETFTDGKVLDSSKYSESIASMNKENETKSYAYKHGDVDKIPALIEEVDSKIKSTKKNDQDDLSDVMSGSKSVLTKILAKIRAKANKEDDDRVVNPDLVKDESKAEIGVEDDTDDMPDLIEDSDSSGSETDSADESESIARKNDNVSDLVEGKKHSAINITDSSRAGVDLGDNTEEIPDLVVDETPIHLHMTEKGTAKFEKNVELSSDKEQSKTVSKNGTERKQSPPVAPIRDADGDSTSSESKKTTKSHMDGGESISRADVDTADARDKMDEEMGPIIKEFAEKFRNDEIDSDTIKNVTKSIFTISEKYRTKQATDVEKNNEDNILAPSDIITKESMDVLVRNYLTPEQYEQILGPTAKVEKSNKFDAVIDCFKKNYQELKSSKGEEKAKEGQLKISWKDTKTVQIVEVSADSVKPPPKDPFKKTELRDNEYNTGSGNRSVLVETKNSKGKTEGASKIPEDKQASGGSLNKSKVSSADKPEKVNVKTGAVKKQKPALTDKEIRRLTSTDYFHNFVNILFNYMKMVTISHTIPYPEHEYGQRLDCQSQKFFVTRLSNESENAKDIDSAYTELFVNLLGEELFKEMKGDVWRPIEILEKYYLMYRQSSCSNPELERMANKLKLTLNLWISNVTGIRKLFGRLRNYDIYDELAPDLFKTDHVFDVMRQVREFGREPIPFEIREDCSPLDITESFANLDTQGSVILME